MIHDRLVVNIFRCKQQFPIEAYHHQYGYNLRVNMISIISKL